MSLSSNIKGVYIIWLRDLKRYWFDKPRIFGSLAQPVLFLLILGTGLSASIGSSSSPLSGGIKFFFPGVLGMTLLFTSIFSAMSIVWDREFGFLKEVLVAPVSRTSVTLGKALGGSSIAMIQGTLMLAFAPVAGIHFTFGKLIVLWLQMFLIAFSLTSFGIVFAARIRSMEGFQMIMNFLLMPMFLLSGALYDINHLPGWLKTLVSINPLSYGVDMLRLTINGQSSFPLASSLAFLSLFGAISVSVAVYLFSRTE